MVLFLAREDSVQMETMFSAILLLLSWLDLVMRLEDNTGYLTFARLNAFHDQVLQSCPSFLFFL